jgi:arabinogalactan oligomer / maltooligosaccharide transport system substrate-binding protein
MKSRLLPIVSLLTIAAVLAVSCGGGAPVSGTISLWHSWKESEMPALNQVIDAFQAKNPDTTFDVLFVPHEDIRGKFETAVATGGGPAVLIGSADWGPAFYDADIVADVSDLASSGFLGTINEAALGSVEYKDALVGLPQTIKGVIMYRNKQIIPDAPSSFEDLVAKAKAAGSTGASLERGLFFSAAHLNGMGGKLMEANGDPAFNNAKGVEWVKLLDSFTDAGPAEYNTDNDVNLFKAGQAGIVIDGTWNLSGFADVIGAENLAVDPWPKVPGGNLSGYVQTENIYLNANMTGAAKDAGWAFIEFFLSEEAQALLVEVGHIPATKGVEVDDPLLQAAAKAFEGGTAFPVIPEMGAYWQSMDNALKTVFDEGTDPAVALAAAETAIKAKIVEIRAGQ